MRLRNHSPSSAEPTSASAPPRLSSTPITIAPPSVFARHAEASARSFAAASFREPPLPRPPARVTDPTSSLKSRVLVSSSDASTPLSKLIRARSTSPRLRSKLLMMRIETYHALPRQPTISFSPLLATFRLASLRTSPPTSSAAPDRRPDWRILIPLSRASELYHALRHSHQSYEHVHRHWRDRYSCAGKNLESRLKRRGLGAQQLRSDAALVIEWFRLCLRHGWLGSARRREPGEMKTTS